MAQSEDEFQAFLDKLNSTPVPNISNSIQDLGPAWKQAILDGTSGDTGGYQQSPMAVDIPPLNAPARAPSWEPPPEAVAGKDSVPEASGGPLDAELGQAMVGASTPTAPGGAASGPSRNILGPDTPINGSGSQAAPMGSPAQNPMDMLSKLFDPKALAAAQEQARKNRMGTGIFQALAQGAGAMTKTPVNEQFWKGLEENANAPVTNLEGQQAQQARKMQAFNAALDVGLKTDANNPNSPFAKLAQQIGGQIAAQGGIKIDPKILSQMAPKNLDDLQKLLIAEMKAQEIKANKALANSYKDSQYQAADEKELRTALDASKASNRSPLGKAENNANLAQRANVFFNRFKDPKTGKIDYGSIPPELGLEAVRSLDNMMSNNGSTVSGMEHLMPQSAMGDMNKYVGYLTNQQRGAGQGSWYKNIHDSIKAEEGLARSQAKAYLHKNAGALSGGRLSSTHPDRFRHIVDSYLPAGEEPRDPHASNFSPDVLKYAETHGISPEQANQIKISRTGGQ